MKQSSLKMGKSVLTALFSAACSWCFGAEHVACSLEPDASVIYKTIDGVNLRMLVFNPQGRSPDEKLPAILLIHGGGWVNGSPDLPLYKKIARDFNSFGLRVFSIQYRLIQKDAKKVEDCVKDAHSAMRYLKSHADKLGIDASKIAVCGGSAGAHLAISETLFPSINEASDDLSISTTPAASILFYPVIDTSKEGYGNNTLGDDWRSLSPLHNVRGGMPPVAIFHAKDDKLTPYAGSVKFKEAMESAGGKCELFPYEKGDHGFIATNQEEYLDVVAKAKKFLAANGFQPN